MGNFANGGFMFLLGGVIALFVTVQSVVFLVKAWRQGKKIGLSVAVMKKAIVSSGIFSLVPSLSILLALVTLSGALGLALPWIRLSVIGAITYELPAAETAMQVYGGTLGSAITDPVVYSSVAWVMTLGSVTPLILIPLFLKKLQSGINAIQRRDSKWTDLLLAAMFVGMISAFLGQALAGGLISILTLLTSAAFMLICALLIKKAKWGWLENFALPISMIGAMAMSIVYTGLIG
ncbi:MAG: DUF5058 family protein [Christensenellales bacterium]|jgi:hypothetical protein